MNSSRAKYVSRHILPLGVLIGLVTLFSGQAQARDTFRHQQMDFGKTGTCLQTTDDGIACFIKNSAKRANLGRTGETYVLNRDGNVVNPKNSVMLFRGNYAWEKNGVVCTVFGKKWTRAGVRCTNGVHGFRLQKGKRLKTF
jgi:hypothetical protein